MKKRTCIIGYTKVCKRMDELARRIDTPEEQRVAFRGFIEKSKAHGRERHREANAKSNAMSRLTHDMRKLALEIQATNGADE
jgi:hypothetical protein